MARPLRIAFPGACYHVTVRGNERRPIFRDDRDRTRFLERLAEMVSRYRLVLHAYVLMRNHYHLLVETPQANLSRAMRQLSGVYTQDFNRRHRRAGHLFQGRFKALLVDKDAYLLELSRYVHLNPVRVGEVHNPAAFRWSSAAAYVGKQPQPGFLTTAAVLKQFDRRPAAARRAYRNFLRQGIREGVERPWGKVVGQTLLGSPTWVQRMWPHVLKAGGGAEIPAIRKLRPGPSLPAVLTQVARAAAMPPARIVQRGASRGSWARPAALCLAWELCGLSQRELGQAFGVSHFAVSKAIHRAQQLRQHDKQFDRMIDKLTATLQARP
jgi:putative transposase